jgi:hypothetical protein
MCQTHLKDAATMPRKKAAKQTVLVSTAPRTVTRLAIPDRSCLLAVDIGNTNVKFGLCLYG